MHGGATPNEATRLHGAVRKRNPRKHRRSTPRWTEVYPEDPFETITAKVAIGIVFARAAARTDWEAGACHALPPTSCSDDHVAGPQADAWD